jgi:D-arabinose 1-dehydrogenase-like Zn-dependent alcohol dehydrogenase
VGTVVKIGEGVKEVAVGDHVGIQVREECLSLLLIFLLCQVY